MISKGYKTDSSSTKILLISVILLFCFGDLARLFARTLDLNFNLYTRLSKIIGILLVFWFILKFKYYKQKHFWPLFTCILLLGTTFIISNILLKNTNYKENIFQNFDYFLKACFLPLLLIPFYSINQNITRTGLNILILIFWINCAFILYGYFFEIRHLQTYYYGDRFGFKGFFDRSTYLSYLFIFTFMYYYYNWIHKQKWIFLFLLVLAGIISLLVGTKRIYFFIFLLLIFHFFYGRWYRSIFFWVFSLALVVIFIVLKEPIVSSLSKTFNVLNTLYIDKGFLSFFTSLRSDLLISYIDLYIKNNWGWANYIFGGGYFQKIRPEMDLIDSYLFFGVFGPLVYVYIYLKYIFNYNTTDPLLIFYFLTVILLALTSSGIIFSANFAIPLIIFGSFFYYQNLNGKLN